jgi:AmmeMemoRadiSam system radical SAM enzyme/AmmeMemoRadiSam system protein B/AmmeMemoRadiSam system protein A
MSQPRNSNPSDEGRLQEDQAARWWHAIDAGGRLQCDLCPRECQLGVGDRGFCFVRQNVDGQMRLTTYGRSTGFCVDPIEKKPLNHFFPGTAVLSFGTAGCNLGCKFCQNWDSTKSRAVDRASQQAEAETIAEAAVQLSCRSVAFTYNDPVIWAEYAIDAAQACHTRGVKTVAVTAGYISPAARTAFYEDIDAANVDLKAFSEDFYFKLTGGSHLQPVLDTLVWLRRETDVWLEVTNLLIPAANDSADEIRRMSDWLLEHLGDQVPVHFSAFHPDYRMQDRPATSVETLVMAHDVAKQQGLRHVYVGNVHDPQRDSTYCSSCNSLLIQRNWYELSAYRLIGDRCPDCQAVVAGRFDANAGDVIRSQWGRRRLPVAIGDYAVLTTGQRGGTPDVHEQDSHTTEAEQIGAERRVPRSSSSEKHSGGNVMAGKETPANRTTPSEPQRLQLTRQQEQAIHRVACEIVSSSLSGGQLTLTELEDCGVGESSVMGAFVTLRRSGHLRACCGTLGQPMRLRDALEGAARRTATEDTRLPPISRTELPHLTVDVSLLHDFQTIRARGQARIDAVTVGRHGLTIRRGASGGLLLPSVPVELGWDAESFLRQVCRKAGLPSTAWQDDQSELQTFEAHVIEGPFDAASLPAKSLAPPHRFAVEQLDKLEEHCRVNILSLIRGATPNYYLTGCDDATVQGVILTVTLPGSSLANAFPQISIRPGVPVQSTLFQLCEAAARWLGQQASPTDDLASLQVSVGVLHDSSLHGTIADPVLLGLDPARRAILILEQDQTAWRYQPDESAEELFQHAAREIQVFNPATANVLSFAIDTNAAAMCGARGPQTVTSRQNRPPAVAGTFYPGEATELNRLLDELLDAAPPTQREPWPAIVVPHAGLQYSGRVAAQVMQQVVIPQRVIILAPKHRREGAVWAVAPHDRWELPNGSVASDPQFARRLADAIEGLELDAVAHRAEHAVEIELPLLARLAPHAQAVGITVGGGDFARCRAFAREFAKFLETLDEMPLLIASTDMNHFASDQENRRLDRLAIDALVQLDPQLLYDTVREHNISMCGVLPTVVVMLTLKYLDRLNTCREVAYTTSAEATGDTSRVVGYAGILLG